MSPGLHFDKLSEREQKLLMVLGVVFALFIFVGIPVYIYSHVASARSTNEEIRELLEQMSSAEAKLAERKRERDAMLMRYNRKTPALASFIEKAASENGLDVPESKDRPEVPHGKRYSERITEVKLQKVSLLPLVKTLEKIKRSGYPVAISRINIKKRTGGPDIFDVGLSVSAFDRKASSPAGASKSEDDQPGRAPKGEEL